MGVEKKVLSVRLDERLIDELRRIAKETNRPLSNLIETILKMHVKEAHSQRETQDGATDLLFYRTSDNTR